MAAPLASHGKTLYVGLKPNQVACFLKRVSLVLFYLSVSCLDSQWKVQELLQNGSVEPEWRKRNDGRYFPLRDDAIDSAVRASCYEQDGSAKDMIIFPIHFTAVGVSTLFPGYLWSKPYGDKTKWCYSDRLRRSFSSADSSPVLLYELSDELTQIM